MSKNKPKGIDEESIPLFLAVEKQASAEKKDSYIDPVTGYQVMTSYFLKNRGTCCNNNCRHCPYKTDSADKKDPK
jgi:hypothetical protein